MRYIFFIIPEIRIELFFMKAENLTIITELRHDLHRHPDLSLKETHTIQILRNFLRMHTSWNIIDRGGWFYAVKPGISAKPPIAFRSELDALPMNEDIELPYASENPGAAHKCGHDGHMAALCGLAMELDGIPLERTVYLIFQPAEEIGMGGEKCAKLIREKGIAEVYAFHNMPGYPEKNIIYRRGLTQPASEGLLIRFHGKTSHAGEPEKGNNPSAAIAELALYSQRPAAGATDGLVLCTIAGMKSGTDDFGISAGEGYICFTLRAEKEAVMKKLEQDLLLYASDLAVQNSLTTEYKIRDHFPETKNHEGPVTRVIAAAKALGLPATEMPDLWRASEDFGYYLKECPGAIFYIGSGDNYPPLHTGAYDFNDDLLEPVVDFFRKLAGKK